MKISLKNFCRGAFVLPILLPMFLLPFEPGVISTILFLSVWFAGAPYLLFAALAVVWIGRREHQEHMSYIMWTAPLLFVPFTTIGWLLHQWIEHASNPNLVISAAELLPVVAFTLLVGYAYVLLVQFTLFVLRRIGIVD